MADRPLIFVLADPASEISFDEARAIHPDAIIATGRSDHFIGELLHRFIEMKMHQRQPS